LGLQVAKSLLEEPYREYYGIVVLECNSHLMNLWNLYLVSTILKFLHVQYFQCFKTNRFVHWGVLVT
jgi:hypothetical protein